MNRQVMTCDLCGKRIPEDYRREWFCGIDGTLFHLAREDGTPIDTCLDCHNLFRGEVMYRLACARENRSIERERRLQSQPA